VTRTLRAPLAAVAVLALAASGGCRLRVYAPDPSPMVGPWAEVRSEATRRAQLYDGLSHRATATATHLSLGVREQQARTLGEWLGWTPAELEARLEAERAAAARAEEFLVAVFTADPKANDLDASTSIWRVALQLDEQDVLASRVTSVESDATLRQLFPHVGPFEVVYRVSFPRLADGDLAGRSWVLLVASALGQLPLDFSAPAVPLRVMEPSPPSGL
jgi:hypothetical protein